MNSNPNHKTVSNTTQRPPDPHQNHPKSNPHLHRRPVYLDQPRPDATGLIRTPSAGHVSFLESFEDDSDPDSWYADPNLGPQQSRAVTASRFRRIEMPLFEGEDAFGWVFRIERYFQYQGFDTQEERLHAAILCMEGPALAWYRWADGQAPFRSWEDLKLQLLARFQPSYAGDIHEQFLSIHQTGSVREYITLFESLAAQLSEIQERVMEGTFVKGLQPEIRASVRFIQPSGLVATIRTTLLVEESCSTYPNALTASVSTKIVPVMATTSAGTTSTTTAAPTTVMGLRPYLVKRMTHEEIAEKKA